MSYILKVLQPGETLLYRTRLHWFVYGRAVILLLIAIACAVAGQAAGREDFADAGLAVGGVFLLFAVISALHAAIRRASTELAVTDHRVIFKRGIVSRYTIEMARAKVESVDVVQSVGGRLFNYGTILVRGTGGTLEPFRMIADPLPFRSAITTA
ncbi:MAG TPA: PH domain-containing protein [Stellaceae bacterium]